MKYYLGIDIGASSGRAIIGYIKDNKLELDEVYRFPNSVIMDNNHLIWDINNIFNEVKNGIRKALEKYPHIESMSIDTWGVDYVLMDGDKEILPCISYRDTRTNEVIDIVHKIIPSEELYNITGCQEQSFNTIYQLYWDKVNGRLDKANNFLMIPEYLIYKLTGVMVHEYTNASTTSLLDSHTFNYSDEIIKRLGFKKELFKSISKPGRVVGELSKSIQEEVCGNILVKLCATHDTGSAVEGIPIEDDNPYLSSGTWSLLGIKNSSVINNSKARLANYSNEYGPNYIRFQKNIMGLWIIQRLSKEMNLDFKEMVQLSKESSYKEIFDVNDKVFLSSLNMKDEIINWFKRNNKTLPKDNKDIINATYLSLAYSYSIAIKELEDITNKKYSKLYIVGGGAKNSYLNELTINYTGLDVIALPIEATAIGNIINQMEDSCEKRSYRII